MFVSLGHLLRCFPDGNVPSTTEMIRARSNRQTCQNALKFRNVFRNGVPKELQLWFSSISRRIERLKSTYSTHQICHLRFSLFVRQKSLESQQKDPKKVVKIMENENYLAESRSKEVKQQVTNDKRRTSSFQSTITVHTVRKATMMLFLTSKVCWLTGVILQEKRFNNMLINYYNTRHLITNISYGMKCQLAGNMVCQLAGNKFDDNVKKNIWLLNNNTVKSLFI